MQKETARCKWVFVVTELFNFCSQIFWYKEICSLYPNSMQVGPNVLKMRTYCTGVGVGVKGWMTHNSVHWHGNVKALRIPYRYLQFIRLCPSVHVFLEVFHPSSSYYHSVWMRISKLIKSANKIWRFKYSWRSHCKESNLPCDAVD